jgi:hypothetical protein
MEKSTPRMKTKVAISLMVSKNLKMAMPAVGNSQI